MIVTIHRLSELLICLKGKMQTKGFNKTALKKKSSVNHKYENNASLQHIHQFRCCREKQIRSHILQFTISPNWFMPSRKVCLPTECSRLCSSIFFKFFSHTILLQPSSFWGRKQKWQPLKKKFCIKTHGVAFQSCWKSIYVRLQTLYYPPHDSFFHASSSRGASDHLTAGLSLEQQTLHSSIAWGARQSTSSCLEDCDRGKQDTIRRNVTEVTLRLQQ